MPSAAGARAWSPEPKMLHTVPHFVVKLILTRRVLSWRFES